jgi:hypothetical protein
MPRLIPLFIEVALIVICLVDVIQTPPQNARNLPKWVWLLLIVLVPYAGPIAWLFAGRPRRKDQPARTAPAFTNYANHARLAPDDDPEFLDALKRGNEREKLLRDWEDNLKQREQDLRPDPNPGPDPQAKPDEEAGTTPL